MKTGIDFGASPQDQSQEDELYFRAVELFNQASFFDAHEAWEDVWRIAVHPEKKFLQGLIQVAVAFHHRSKGNLIGARSLLARACRNLNGYPDEYGGIRLASLRESLAQWQHALAHGGPAPPLPRIEAKR